MSGELSILNKQAIDIMWNSFFQQISWPLWNNCFLPMKQILLLNRLKNILLRHLVATRTAAHIRRVKVRTNHYFLIYI